MFDIGASFDREIMSIARIRPTVLFIEPEDPRVVEAALRLPRFARPVFLTSREKVEAVIREHLAHVDDARVEFTLMESAFCEPEEDCAALRDELAAAVLEMPAERRPCEGLEEARRFVNTPAGFGIMAVHEGHADMVVGGARHEPRDFFRPMIKVMRVEPVLCEAGIIVLPDDHPHDLYPHNILVIGDVGVNATMTPQILARSAVGTAAVARDLLPMDELPSLHGVIVSYSNRGGDEGPSPQLVREATALVPRFLEERCRRGERYRSIDIQGEVKINVALSRRSAQLYRKGGESVDVGGANVLVAPNLDTGNLLFHLFCTRYPDGHKFGAIFGIRFRGVDLPMDVEPEDAALAVKASILRLQKFGEWERTPRDTFFPRPRILAINPGSTSTKLAVYEGDEEVFAEELRHSAEELEPFEGERIVSQFEFRKQVIEDFLAEHDLAVAQLDAVSARGGLVHPIPHGTYAVNERMREDLLDGTGTDHASNLGALIAAALVGDSGKPAFIVDPVVVDEMDERCRYTGFKEIRRRAISHALNQIATAHRFAHDNETFYERLNLIVCHMGGGITIGAHRRGRFCDVNNGLDGEGPFTPQRSGSLPVGDLIRLCFSGKYTRDELLKLNKGRGGLIDLLGTADFQEVEQRYLADDPEVEAVFDAICYQISKWICSLVPAFDGETVDRVLLTGGMARSRALVRLVDKACKPLGCGLSVYPGENEMAALTQGALRVLRGREEVREYAPGE